MTELLLPVVLPLSAGLLALLWQQQARALGLLSQLSALLIAGYLLAQVMTQGSVSISIGGWEPGLGILLQLDGFSAALLLMTNLILLGISVYAVYYFSPTQAVRFWPLWLMLITSLNALFLSGDLFNLYVTLELLTLSAVALTSLGKRPESLQGALRYLLFSLLGSLLFLAGTALLFMLAGRLDLPGLASQLHLLHQTAPEASPTIALAAALITSGLIAKSALLPMHIWLPPAHASAPAPVSAALSALVVKGSVYLLFRLWLELFQPSISTSAAGLLGVLGSLAVLWGSWQAWRAERLKLLAAYSTVSQIGYLFIFLPLLLTPGLTASAQRDLLVAVMLMLMSHAFAKSALFMAIGLVQQRQGNDNLQSLAGLASKTPGLATVFALASIALVGLPPSGAFLGKWLLLDAAFRQGQWLWIMVVAVGTALAAGYALRLMGVMMQEPGTTNSLLKHKWRLLPPLTLSLLATLGLGSFAQSLWPLLSEFVSTGAVG